MKKVIIVIVNGAAGSGKTTLQNLVKKHFGDIYNIHIRSSVDVMYQVYKMLGWNGNKDDTFRNDMHTLKQMYINNCDGPTRDIIKAAMVALTNDSTDDTIIFYDIREAEEINKLLDLVRPLNLIGIYCKTMLIRRTTVESLKHGNHADDDILTSGIEYDITVDNSGDFRHLEERIGDIVEQILEV
jgi:hypothetical protein